MIDNVDFYFNVEDGANWLLNIEDKKRYDTGSYIGFEKNMKIRQSPSGVHIMGSIAKYLHGENITSFTRNDVKNSLELLQNNTGIDFSKGIVRSVEFGSNFIMNKPVFFYLQNFGEKQRYKQNIIKGKQNELETVSYFTFSGGYKFKAYNKTQETSDKRKKIPELYQNCNVLRLELTIKGKHNFIKQFQKELSPFDLADYSIYEKLDTLFYNFYSEIEKTNNDVYIDISEKLTPAKFQLLLAEQFKQSHKEEVNSFIQSAKENNCLSKSNLSRIKQIEKSIIKTNCISANDLNVELDEKVRFAVLHAA